MTTRQGSKQWKAPKMYGQKSMLHSIFFNALRENDATTKQQTEIKIKCRRKSVPCFRIRPLPKKYIDGTKKGKKIKVHADEVPRPKERKEEGKKKKKETEKMEHDTTMP